jgi:DNA-binding NarL/FixJ family response regulator
MTLVRVLVADDQAIVRDGLVTVLSLAEGIEVVGEAADGRQAADLAVELAPDVVLMDLRMPVLDGAAATALILQHVPSARVLVLTTYADDASIAGALAAGALGYLTKDAGRRELLAAVRAAAEGQAVFDTTVRDRLVAGFRSAAAEGREPAEPTDPGRLRTRFPELTAREAEVLALMAKGLPNPDIAGRLFLSTTTVKSYVNTVFAKLGVTSRGEAIALVHRG